VSCPAVSDMKKPKRRKLVLRRPGLALEELNESTSSKAAAALLVPPLADSPDCAALSGCRGTRRRTRDPLGHEHGNEQHEHRSHGEEHQLQGPTGHENGAAELARKLASVDRQTAARTRLFLHITQAPRRGRFSIAVATARTLPLTLTPDPDSGHHQVPALVSCAACPRPASVGAPSSAGRIASSWPPCWCRCSRQAAGTPCRSRAVARSW
jgi:hypothetical protein